MPNTDNMGKLYVTLFAFTTALKTNLQWLLHPDTRICSRSQSCTVTAFWLKYQDSARMLRRVTQPPHIAGPLGGNDIRIGNVGLLFCRITRSLTEDY